MRIAMVCEHASPLGAAAAGGQAVHLANLSQALVEHGHEVTVYTRRADPGLPDSVRVAPGYRVVQVDAGPVRHLTPDELLAQLNTFARRLHEHCLKDPPDLLHSHFWRSGLAATVVGRALGVPTVHTHHVLGSVKRRHEGAADLSPAARDDLERAVGRAASWIVATSSDEVSELIRIGTPRNRVSVVPCGVDLDRFTPDGPAQPTTAPHRVLTVGRLAPRKGFADLITALPGVPDTELVIAGGTPADGVGDSEQARLRELADRLGVADRVVLLGQVAREELPGLLRSADVVACVPWYEPFGMVALEAMACGVPVVASAVGGLADTVVHGVTGLHVPAHNPRELASRLRALLADPARRYEMGSAGRDRARARYPWSRIAADTERIYRRLCPAADGALFEPADVDADAELAG